MSSPSGFSLHSRIDPLGKIAFLQGQEETDEGLFETSTGAKVGDLNGVAALGPEASIYVFGGEKGYTLARRKDNKDLAHLNTDFLATGYLFDKTGRYIFISNRDGSITVWDLKELQKRLTEFGLGW